LIHTEQQGAFGGGLARSEFLFETRQSQLLGLLVSRRRC
jgi:hypothetical protein